MLKQYPRDWDLFYIKMIEKDKNFLLRVYQGLSLFSKANIQFVNIQLKLAK
jgi:hypothetical protein